MRQMRQVLRLHASGASDREIGRIVDPIEEHPIRPRTQYHGGTIMAAP